MVLIVHLPAPVNRNNTEIRPVADFDAFRRGMPDIATTDGKLKVSPGIDFLRQTRYKAPSHFFPRTSYTS